MANGRIWLKVAPEAYLMVQCTDNDCQWCPCSCNNCMSTYNVKSTRLLSSYPQNFIHLFIHSPVKFLWLLIFTDTLMCSLLWPGHFDFFYSCVGLWRILYWFGDPLSCQESGNDQWKVRIYYIFSRIQFCQEGNNSWIRIFLVSQFFQCQVQVSNLCPGEGGGGEGGCSGFQVTRMLEWGQKSKPKKIPRTSNITQECNGTTLDQ